MSIDGSGSTFENYDRETPSEDATQLEISNLKTEIALMRIEMMDRKLEEHKTDVPTFKSSISGQWKLVRCSNVDEYLGAHGAHPAHGASSLFNTIFQLADVHLEFHEDAVRLCYQVGSLKHYEKTFELSTPNVTDGSLTYILDDSMKTVYVDSGEAEERFLRDGRLQVVAKRNGVECTRVYERRVAPEDVEGEKDDAVCRIRTLREDLDAILEKLNILESLVLQNHSLYDLKQQLHHISSQRHGTKEEKEEFQETMEQIEQSNAPMEYKEEKLERLLLSIRSDPAFIKNCISGEWKIRIVDGSLSLHLKVDHDQFMQRWSPCLKFSAQTFGEVDADGCCVEIEENMVVWKTNGVWRWKFYIEDGKLVECNSASETCLVYEKV